MSELHTAILLNGPPGVGKDTIAKLIVQNYGYQTMEFKQQLYIDTAKYFEVDLDEFIARHEDRELKEVPWLELELRLPGQPLFNYFSTRQALIFVSEFVIKKACSIDYFGQAAIKRCLATGDSEFVFSDSGFPHETTPIFEAFKNAYIFHLCREGYDFGGDSRDYVWGFPNTYLIQLVEGRPDLAALKIMHRVLNLGEAA